jgi:hypothetical protein
MAANVFSDMAASTSKYDAAAMVPRCLLVLLSFSMVANSSSGWLHPLAQLTDCPIFPGQCKFLKKIKLLRGNARHISQKSVSVTHIVLPDWAGRGALPSVALRNVHLSDQASTVIDYD